MRNLTCLMIMHKGVEPCPRDLEIAATEGARAIWKSRLLHWGLRLVSGSRPAFHRPGT